MDKSNLNRLLSNTRTLLRHQKEIEVLRGETFNVFSILRMESKENETHSAFLAELLNPNGSHLKGSVFLELFLKTIGYHSKTDKPFDYTTATVRPEKHIGSRDDIRKIGGRIDIFIEDKQKNCISIENKIYAGDQNTQIERYCNFLKETNSVYYLTRIGGGASLESKGRLEEGKDYFAISYKEHILQWLQLCIKETAEAPILRETIKQYIVLIKNLTSTMDEKSNNSLLNEMFKYYEEASYIAANFNNAARKISEVIRQDVIKKLKDRLTDPFVVVPGSATNLKYSQIWIKLKGHLEDKIFFGIESFSGQGHNGGEIFIGVFCSGGGRGLFRDSEGELVYTEVWNRKNPIKDYNGIKINLGNPQTLGNLYNDKDFREGFEEHLVTEIEEYLNYETPFLLDVISRKEKGETLN